MPVLNKPNQKARYVLSLIDSKEYCKSTGKFNLHLKEHNLTEEQYVEKYEGGVSRTCPSCGTRHFFDKGTWLWSETCHVRKCELSSWKIGWSKVDREAHGKKSSEWRADQEKVASVNASRHVANQRVGEDGLTGYERTKLKREQVLEARTGNKFDAGWDKMRETWKTASDEHRKAHGEKIKEGVLEKHGVEYIMQVPEILEKQKKTLNRPEERKRRSEQMLKQLETMTLGYSKISQALFHMIQQHLDTHASFHDNGGEIRVGIYALDFCLDTKVIEFNGDWWHANPAVYESDQILSHFDTKRTARSIWERDAKRLEFIKSKGYDVKVVWESDFRKNPKQIVQECVQWLKK